MGPIYRYFSKLQQRYALFENVMVSNDPSDRESTFIWSGHDYVPNSTGICHGVVFQNQWLQDKVNEYYGMEINMIEFSWTVVFLSILKVNEKIARLTDAAAHFITHDFTFATTNTRHLWQSMSPEDRKLFDFDMTSVDWNEYLLRFAKGLREFIGKEEPETIPAAKSKLKR